MVENGKILLTNNILNSAPIEYYRSMARARYGRYLSFGDYGIEEFELENPKVKIEIFFTKLKCPIYGRNIILIYNNRKITNETISNVVVFSYFQAYNTFKEELATDFLVIIKIFDKNSLFELESCPKKENVILEHEYTIKD